MILIENLINIEEIFKNYSRKTSELVTGTHEKKHQNVFLFSR